MFDIFQSTSSKELTKGGKGDKNAGNKSPAKGAKGAGAQKKGHEEESPKTESKLKKRGEDELDIKFISKILTLLLILSDILYR